MKIADILRLVKSRDASHGRWGIGTADIYLRQLLTPGFTKPEGWDGMLKSAAGQLVYCHPDMVCETKEAGGEFDPTPHAILEFNCVVTTKSMDRDGDVMHPDGANLDPGCCLLWQHMPDHPIGKMVRQISKNDQSLRARFAIADTALGKDAATLVEFGALRISHGFLPLKFAERRSKDDAGHTWKGFDISEFDVLEVSLVSVPSNVDSVITAFSRQKLFSPMVKSWAGGLFDSRPTMVSVKSAFKPTGNAMIDALWTPDPPPVAAKSHGCGNPLVDQLMGIKGSDPDAVKDGDEAGDVPKPKRGKKKPPKAAAESDDDSEPDADDDDAAGDDGISEKAVAAVAASIKGCEHFGQAFVHHGQKAVHHTICTKCMSFGGSKAKAKGTPAKPQDDDTEPDEDTAQNGAEDSYDDPETISKAYKCCKGVEHVVVAPEYHPKLDGNWHQVHPISQAWVSAIESGPPAQEQQNASGKQSPNANGDDDPDGQKQFAGVTTKAWSDAAREAAIAARHAAVQASANEGSQVKGRAAAEAASKTADDASKAAVLASKTGDHASAAGAHDYAEDAHLTAADAHRNAGDEEAARSHEDAAIAHQHASVEHTAAAATKDDSERDRGEQRIESNNQAHGAFAEFAQHHDSEDKAAEKFHEAAKAIVDKHGVSGEVARNYLDSAHGRHVAEIMNSEGKDVHSAMLDQHGKPAKVTQALRDVAEHTAKGGFKSFDGYGKKWLGCCQEIAGSWEDIRRALSQSAYEYLCDHGLQVPAPRDGEAHCMPMANVAAMFDDHAIVEVWLPCSGPSSPGDQQPAYSIDWKQGEDGPEFTGDPRKVSIETTVTVAEQKSFAGTWTKAKGDDKYMNDDGSFKNGFSGCLEYMQEVKGHSEESAKKLCAYIGRAAGKIKTSHEAVIRAAEDFDESFRVLWEGKGIEAVGANLKSDPKGPAEAQRIWFDAEAWSSDEARDWLKANGYAAVEFKDWDESKHPRQGGRFTSGGGGKTDAGKGGKDSAPDRDKTAGEWSKAAEDASGKADSAADHHAAAGAHDFASRVHKMAADEARKEGDDKGAKAHDAKAQYHADKSQAHEKAAGRKEPPAPGKDEKPTAKQGQEASDHANALSNAAKTHASLSDKLAAAAGKIGAAQASIRDKLIAAHAAVAEKLHGLAANAHKVAGAYQGALGHSDKAKEHANAAAEHGASRDKAHATLQRLSGGGDRGGAGGKTNGKPKSDTPAGHYNTMSKDDKAGRVISGSNEAKIRDAMDCHQEILKLGPEHASKACKALVKQAHGCLQSVVESVGPSDDGGAVLKNHMSVGEMRAFLAMEASDADLKEASELIRLREDQTKRARARTLVERLLTGRC